VRNSFSVLQVEDNPIVALTTERYLRDRGYRVKTVVTGEDALQEAPLYQPDVLLCDLSLPGDLNGFDVARALTKKTACAQARYIAVTGHDDSETVVRADEAGFEQVLTKPVSLPSLDALLLGGQV
jgi:CheY-like chemotaxis protein